MTRDINERIADGIYRIPLPLPLDDLKSINAYALESAAGLVLVDPGWATHDTEQALHAAIADIGYRMSDVTAIIATHGHWDHYTQALAIRRDHGSLLYLGALEKRSIDAFSTLSGAYPRQAELLRAAGAPDLATVIESLPLQPHETGMTVDYPDIWMNDGDVVELGDRTLSIHATPGHTRGHMVVVDAAAGVMFTGDHVLPRITPSTGFERDPDSGALGSFLSSLRVTLALPDMNMLPAHGPVAPSVHDRAFELLAHHAERLETIHELGANGRSPYEIAKSMPWTRHHLRLDQLTPVHQMVAVLEVAAHLEHDPHPFRNHI